jgi:hypothetical protein
VAAGGDELGEVGRYLGDGFGRGDADDVETLGLGVADEAGLQAREFVRRQKSRLV